MPPPLQSQTNQRGRRRMINLPPRLSLLEWRGLVESGHGEWSCCSAVMDAATKIKCSSAVPSGFFVDAQRVIFSVDLVNSYFCSHPSLPSVSQFNWSKTKRDVLYSVWFFSFFFSSLQRVTVSGSRCWEGNRSQLCYFYYFYTEEKEAKCSFCALCRFLFIPCEHSVSAWPETGE